MLLKGKQDYHKPGDYNAYCDVCGFKFKASELQKRWDGYRVCQKDWEPRHILDFIRGPEQYPQPEDINSKDGS